MNKVIAFVPCRSGSKRIPKKNYKKFGNNEFGLIQLKISQLLKVKELSSIVISTNDKKIKMIAKSFNSPKIVLDHRENNLASDKAKTDDLIKHVKNIISSGHVLWTHVTSPFVDAIDYSKSIKIYFNNIKKYDSLMSVKEIKTFCITEKNRAINFNRKYLKWPFTQKIRSIYAIDSAIFINSVSNYKKYNDRIGQKPFLFSLNEIKSIDIDWPDDFEIAEKIYNRIIL